MREYHTRWLFAAALLLAALGMAGCLPYEYKGTVLDPPKPLDDFTLPTADGGTFRLSDQQGQLVLVYFGYTYCPDVCPATMYQVGRVAEQLGEDAEQVQVVMVTVDPARDTPEQLDRYVKNFNPTFVGLRTDDTGQLDAVLAQFGAYYVIEDPQEDSASGYLVTHTASLFLVDGQNALREVFTYGTPAEDIAADIRQMLKR